MITKQLILGLSVWLLLSACHENGKSKISQNETFTSELPMPEIPDSIVDRNAKLVYVVNHFWDKLDFRDTVLTLNDEFMEQNFANYILILEALESENDRLAAVEGLLEKASVTIPSFNKIKDISGLYLADPNSPMKNDELRIAFLHSFLTHPERLGREEEKIRMGYELEMRSKNRVGTRASDFSYVDLANRHRTLYTTPTGSEGMIVVFYDSDCDHCANLFENLQANEGLSKALEEKRLVLLAIDVKEDKELWRRKAITLPTNWIKGFNTDNIEGNDVYWFPALPSIYHLYAGSYEVLNKN